MIDTERMMITNIPDLELSNDFKEKCRKMGFQNLKQIVETDPVILMEKEGFDYNWFGELVSLLSDRKILHKLQPTPGNNPC